MMDDREMRLAAWMDEELGPKEAAAFEIDLSANPDLAAQARRWKVNDVLIVSALSQSADDPIEPALLKRLGLGDPPTASVSVAMNDNRPGWRRYGLASGMVAAGVALSVLVLPKAEPTRPDALSYALETTPSGVVAKLSDGRTLKPTLTVQARDGRFCREYRIAATIGLACREHGHWRIEQEGKGSEASDPDNYRLAAGANSSVLAAGYHRIGASDPFSREEESALISRKWESGK